LVSALAVSPGDVVLAMVSSGASDLWWVSSCRPALSVVFLMVSSGGFDAGGVVLSDPDAGVAGFLLAPPVSFCGWP
jgi:hypothetical protein